MSATATTLLERLAESDSPRPDEPAWMRADRADAHAWLRNHGLPSARDEAWKYTPLDDILSTTFDPAPMPTSHQLDIATIDALAGDFGGPRLVFVNGSFAPELSAPRSPIAGIAYGNQVSMRTAAPAEVDPGLRGIRDLSRFDGFQALNRASARDAAVILIEPDAHITAPIHVVHISIPGNTPMAVHPRTRIQAAAGSDATIIETYTGTRGRILTNAVTTIDIGPGAAVTHYKVQTETAGAVHLAHTSINQAAASSVHSCSIMLGSGIARNAVDVVLAGPDATLEVDGLYLPTDRQRHDTVITVDHAASSCTSRQLFKGVIDDSARGSFSGRIIVRPGTVETDAGQTSRSLVLQPTAQADTRPWLEIFADDVKCTHGATVGRLDDEAIFYLRTRGLAEAEARTMLIGAFVNEITDTIHLPTLRSHIESVIASKRSFVLPQEPTP